MTRVKRGFVGMKHHKKIIKLNKGYRGSHSKLFQTANQQNMKAERYAFFDRRKKKSLFRKIWIQQINGALKKNNVNYSKGMHKLKEQKILINKKILSKIAQFDQPIFQIITT